MDDELCPKCKRRSCRVSDLVAELQRQAWHMLTPNEQRKFREAIMLAQDQCNEFARFVRAPN